MDVVLALESSARCVDPARWRTLGCLLGQPSADAALAAIRRCDLRSDQLLEALIGIGPDDVAAKLVVAGLLRLGLYRCRGNRVRADALAGELAVVLGEAWAGQLPRNPNRRLASIMVDRAWGRVRAAERRDRIAQGELVDLGAVRETSLVTSFEDEVVGQVAVEQFERRLTSPGAFERQVARAWRTAGELADEPRPHSRDRNRWQYARRVLAERVTPDLELHSRTV